MTVAVGTGRSLEQSCPLCGSRAVCAEVADPLGNMVAVQCRRCADYRISGWAVRQLTLQYALLRELLAVQAGRVPPEMMLVIDQERDAKGPHPVRARLVLRAEYVERTV